MRISTVLQLASIASSVSVAAARELQLSTVTSDTSIGTSVDDKRRNKVVVKRLLRAVNESATKREEERGPPASGAAQVLTDFAKAAYDKGLRTLDWGQIEKKTPRAFTHVDLPDEESKAEYAHYLLRALIRTMKTDQSELTVQLLDVLSQHFGNDALAFALVAMKLSNVAPEVPAAAFHHLYLERMIANGFVPSSVLQEWYHEALPFDYIVRNLDDFIQLYNQNPEIEKVSLLETLQDYFRDEFDLVRKVSHSMGESEEMKNIHEELVKEVARKYTFDEFFQHVAPKGRDGKWDFNTLYVFAHSSEISIDSLLEKLKSKFNGFDKLVPVLVKASEYDQVAKTLHEELVNYFVRAEFSFLDVVETLKLEKGELDDAKLKTLRMFAQQDMEARNVRYNWRRDLDNIRLGAFVVSIPEYIRSVIK
ncbi:hypothetical protein PsorP6_015015 [Peronosclerospora sorghi]|uniref:Uncharacterized protein n=1 Tax=Peronosclerospora sorghi TaxID=230839 RepID=A0ACC0VRS8_9STRA|nr:hypothetical protein PsorP6_015015 [Peronosclerospora sorghi]